MQTLFDVTLDSWQSIITAMVAVLLGTGLLHLKFKNSVTVKIGFLFLVSAAYMGILGSVVGRLDLDFSKDVLNSLLVSLVSFAFLLGIAMYMYTSIAKPLQELGEASKQLSEGNLDTKIPNYSTKDEIGALTLSLEKFLATLNIQGTIQTIAVVSESLIRSAESLAQATDEVSSAGEEITSMAEEITKGAVQQSERIQTTIALGEQLRATFQTTFKGMADATHNIEKINSQINILSLNASIEAARAGEYGRGFAVVSGNIQSLSKDTKESVGLITTAQANLKELLTKLILQVNQSVEEVGALAEETAGGAEEVSSAAEEQTASLVELSEESRKLETYAGKLRSMVENFG